MAMGDFHHAITTLLDAFSRGLGVIKRKKHSSPADSTQKEDDRRLSKSLCKSRADVREAYSRDLARFGNGIAVGDCEFF